MSLSNVEKRSFWGIINQKEGCNVKKLIVLTGLIIAVLSGCATAEKETGADSYVVRINDTEVSKEEFNIYFYETQKGFEEIGGEDIWETDFDGRSAIEVAKDNTLNTLIYIKTAVDKAEKAGIEISEEERIAAGEAAVAIFRSLDETAKKKIGASLDDYMSVLEENALYNAVYNDAVKDYTVSDAEYESYYTSYSEEIIEQYKIYVDSTEPVDEAKAKDYGRVIYEEYMKQQYFYSESEKWLNDAGIEKNNSLWDEITLIK